MSEDLKSKNIVVIVESPNKVKHIQEYLKKAGYKNLKVMASIGHIMKLADARDSYHNSGIYVDKDFDLNLKVSEDKYEVVNKLKAATAAADIVYLMSDPDREGEAISWSLIKFLDIDTQKIKRAVTHEITPKAVVAAIENPIVLDEALVSAALARMTIDKMIGYRMSPIAKTYLGAKSVGRCQSAGLKLIVDREKEIENFVPETYYDIYLKFKKNKTEFKAKYIGTDKKVIDHLTSKADVNVVKAMCTDDYVISDIVKHEKHESAKSPFCTATFQQEVSSKLGLTVKDAMSCAQKLFEAGQITYMRTDDTDMSPEFLSVLQSYVDANYGKSSFNKPKKVKKGGNTQEGHECLRITNPDLTPEEFNKINPNNLLQKVYKIVWQRTIASVLPDAVISETNYIIANNNHRFSLVSNEVLNEGYRKVYSYKDDDTVEETAVKETFTKDEKLKYCKLEEAEKQTQPKPRFKEATFIKELQKREIGRPSTYATIVETVLSPTRGYCELDAKTKQMIPTERGMQLINFLDRSFSNIINIEWTKEMEAGLDKIANNMLSKSQFLTDFYNTLENTVKNNKEVITTEAQVCPNCGAPMVVRRSRFGKLFYGCSTYPKCNCIVNIK